MSKKFSAVHVATGEIFYADAVSYLADGKMIRLTIVDPDTKEEFDGPDYPMLIPTPNVIAIKNKQFDDEVYQQFVNQLRMTNFKEDETPEKVSSLITPDSVSKGQDTEAIT